MLSSPRLRYEPVSIDSLDRFHLLVQDAHIRRHLMDGETLPREWSEALLARCTGKGYATEMARASIEEARATAGFTEILAGVDDVNAESRRVLEKLGLARDQTMPGAFGDMFTYRLRP